MDDMTERVPGRTSWVTGISAITLFAEDLNTSKQFYQRVFDVPVHYEDENSAVFLFGQVMINVLATTSVDDLIAPAVMASRGAGARQVYTLPVDNVDALCVELTRRGVELLNGPVDRPWGVRTASFLDPAGHIWELATRR
ncbi:VOC family protein [Deinococcus sonorensis]|uniref:VOC family protein n=2 Tax=Deinococcus sonorensis TaxID=309891 RepID=A0AAU7U7D0_9DEIO